MSVMSTAEARQGAGASPEIPRPRLQIARSAAGQDDADAAIGSPLPGAGQPVSSEQSATESSVSALRVTQVRVVREVSVRTLRAGGTRSVTASPGQVPSQARVAAQARVSSSARVSSQARVTSQARAASQAGAGQAQVMAHSRVMSQARVVRQVRVAGLAPGRPGPVRLTRRGRLAVAGFVIGAVIVAVTVLWMSVAGSVQASSHASAPGSAYRGMTQVVVQPGQTLWSIAAAAEPSANLWPVVQQIINVNALSGAEVQTGQLLWVPKN
jgi:nucleoid-associated protein YgaU